MTEYCTIDDMIDRFEESELASITDRSGSASPLIDDDVVNTAIQDAGAIIDGELLNYYEPPTKPYANVLQLISCDIARWLLYEDSLDEDNIIQRRYDRAINLLGRIASGQLHVVGLAPLDADRLRVIRA